MVTTESFINSPCPSGYMSLEDKLAQTITNGEEFDTAEALLIASGIDSKKTIADYKEKLRQIALGFRTSFRIGWLRDSLQISLWEEFRRKYPQLAQDNEALESYALHKYLFGYRPTRYNPHRFLFHEVINAQLSPTEEVGNCVGLASLFHTVGELIGIKTVPMLTYNHIYLLQETVEGNKINIETATPYGYDYKRHDGRVSNKRGIVSSVYAHRISVAHNKEEKDRLTGIWAGITLDRSHILACNAFSFFENGNFKDAERCFKTAIELDPLYAAYFAGYNKRLVQESYPELAMFFTRLSLEQNVPCMRTAFIEGYNRP